MLSISRDVWGRGVWGQRTLVSDPILIFVMAHAHVCRARVHGTEWYTQTHTSHSREKTRYTVSDEQHEAHRFLRSQLS